MINRVVISGRLGQDPELRKTTSGVSVCNYALAIERFHVGEQQKITDWVNCVAWRQAADYLTRYAKKGDMVEVEGQLQNSSYTEKNTGKRITTTEVRVDRLSVVSRKNQDPIAVDHEALVPQKPEIVPGVTEDDLSF